MRASRRLTAATLGLALLLGTVVSTHAVPSTASSVAAGARVTGPMEPGDNWFAGQRQMDGLSRAEAAQAARRQALSLQKRTAGTNPELAGVEWELEGPRNIGGRVTDIAVEVDPTAPNRIFVAAASGGVWKSEDAGMTYVTAWPDHFPQAIGALQMGPDGTLWAGTGEANPGGGSIVFGGEGVFKSTDRGASWEHVGLTTSGAIGRIAVDPSNPDRVLVAASGDLSTSRAANGACTRPRTAATPGRSCSQARTTPPVRSTSRWTRATRTDTSCPCGTTSGPPTCVSTAGPVRACS